MNIQRKYSLPNCTLLLEGLSDMTRTANFQELRPELSILVNAECHISSYTQPIVGGREFFESLVRAVSAYAQEVLSNIPNPQVQNHDSELVEFQKIDSNRHQLTVHSEMTEDNLGGNTSQAQQSTIQIVLNTVQLFDLVEAVDQFFADSQTLPELSLELHPVNRSYGGSSQTLLKQAIPATVGLSSLAVAAFAFSLIPAPQVRPPAVKPEDQSSTSIPIATETASPTTTPTEIPTPATTPTETAAPVTVKDLETLLKTVPEITDPSQLRALNRQVYNLIHPAWTNRSELSNDLVYRLGVAADGSIVGYKAVNQKASDAIEKTPLPKLLYNPANRVPNEPIAQFKVVFTQKGILEISPWLGYAKTPEVTGEKITDTSKIKELNQKLYSTIRQNWSVTPTFASNLKYRVAVNKEGVIADYEPLNQVAFDHFRETPLPQMFQSVYGSNVAAPDTKDPLAHFQVVFTPKGELEVTHWKGYK